MRSRAIGLLIVIYSSAACVEARAAIGNRGPTIAPDESASVTQFIAAGVPSTDREWSADDYQRFISVIRPISRDHPRGLPRFDSNKSGAIMRRVISEQNFGLLHDRNLPVTTRMAQGAALSQATAALAGIYGDASSKGELFDRELVELMAFIVKVNAELWALADELLSTLTQEERNARGGSLDMMRSGSAQIVSGALTTFTETEVYRPSELRRFASLLAPTLPSIVQRLTSESRSETIVRLRSLISQQPDQSLRSLLGNLLDAIEGKARPAA